MTANENTSLPDAQSDSSAIAVQQPTMLERRDAAWANLPELAVPVESASSTLVPLWHGFRRHAVLAVSLGLACGAILALAILFGWGPQYQPTALLQVGATGEYIMDPNPQDRFTADAFEVYKNSQAQLLKSPFVLNAALRKEEVISLPIISAQRDPVAWLAGELRVDFPGKAEIMAVSLKNKDKEEATKLVNAVVDAYLTEVVEKARTSRGARLNRLDEVYAEKNSESRSKRVRLVELTERLGTGDPETVKLKQRMAVQEFADYQRQLSQTKFMLNKAKGELQAQEFLLEAIDKREITPLELMEYTAKDPMTSQLSKELGLRRMDMAYMEASLKAGHKSKFAEQYRQDMLRVQAQLDELTVSIRDNIKALKRAEIDQERQSKSISVAILLDQVEVLEQDVDKKRREAAELGRSSIDLEIMRAEIDQLDDVLKGIKAKSELLNVELQSRPRVQLLQKAFEPETSVNLPARIALSILGVLIGLIIPGGLIAWWDTRKRCINSSEDVSKNIGLTVIGTVPMIPARIIRQLGSPSKKNQSWQMRLTESIDSIVARLLRKAKVEQTSAILVSSAGQGEGKTTLATQLAMSFARNGRRTVLVDFDLRQPAFDEVFELPLEPGVSEVLRQETGIADVIHKTITDNLSVVTAGRWDRDALAALANGASGPIFDWLRDEYEFIVVDASPILSVADTRFVSQSVDAVILSIFRDVSRMPRVQAACEILEAFGVGSLEAVVTCPTDNLPTTPRKYGSGAPA